MDDFELTPFEVEMINLHLMEEANRQSHNTIQRSPPRNQYDSTEEANRQSYNTLQRSSPRNQYDEPTGNATWFDLVQNVNDSFGGTLIPPAIMQCLKFAVPALRSNHVNNILSRVTSNFNLRSANNRSCHLSNSTIRTNNGANSRANNSANSSANNVAGSNVKDVTCLICFESLFDRNKMATECGHLLCSTCMDHLIAAQQDCPVCKREVRQNRIFPIYF